MIQYKNIDDFFEHMDSITSEHIYEERSKNYKMQISSNKYNCNILLNNKIVLSLIVEYKFKDIDIKYIKEKYNYYAFLYGFQRIKNE